MRYSASDKTEIIRLGDYQEFRVWPERFESVHAIARVKRSPNRMANWALASDHSRAGMVHSFSDRTSGWKA